MLNIDQVIKKTLSHAGIQDKAGRPLGKDMDHKTYHRITISLTQKEKDKIIAFAGKNYKGNVSECIKDTLKKKKVL